MYRTKMVTVLATTILAGVACAQDLEPVATKLTPSFLEADLSAVANTLGELTARKFVIDPGVCAQISAGWETPLSAEELYQVFLSIVRALGFTATEQGSITRIMLDENARKDSQPACRRYPPPETHER